MRGSEFRAELVAALQGMVSEEVMNEDGIYWQQMTPDELRKLAASPLVTIGAHGFLHDNLGEMMPPAAIADLLACRAFLKSAIGQEVNALAWPDGSYTRAVADAALELGFTQQCLLDSRFPEDADDPHSEVRLGVNPFANWNNQLIAILKGTYY